MTYYKKMGRLSDEEQAVVDVIEQIRVQKDIPLSDVPICNSLDDLLEAKLLLEAYEAQEFQESDKVEEQLNSEETDSIEVEELEENNQGSDSKGTEEPELEPIKAEEADEFEPTEDVSESKNFDEDQAPTLENHDGHNDTSEKPEFIAPNYDPFADDIIERSYNANDTKEDSRTMNSLDSEEETELEESSSTPVDELNPRTKKRAAEQTADAILKGYARIAPMPFKWLAKVDEQKVEQLAMEGQIDINIEVEPGTTFDEYMKQTNAQVDEVFEVEEETLDEIREPLIEVLMEQEMELTPQQRLMMAVISHLFQMLTVSLKLRKQNNRILQYQKQMTFQGSAV